MQAAHNNDITSYEKYGANPLKQEDDHLPLLVVINRQDL